MIDVRKEFSFINDKFKYCTNRQFHTTTYICMCIVTLCYLRCNSPIYLRQRTCAVLVAGDTPVRIGTRAGVVGARVLATVRRLLFTASGRARSCSTNGSSCVCLLLETSGKLRLALIILITVNLSCFNKASLVIVIAYVSPSLQVFQVVN